MSTSSDFGWTVAGAGTYTFEYPAAQAALPGGFEPAAGVRQVNDAGLRHAELQEQLQHARQEGHREGELRARKVFEEALRSERNSMQRALSEFSQERQTYFQRVESEVVGLSLAIARRILHREAQIDKSLLAGMVRVSIEHLAESTGVIVRIHPSQEEEWIRYFAASELHPVPKVIADPDIAPDACIISTQLGTTEIGIESQLQEIEKGLFDLLAQRPGA